MRSAECGMRSAECGMRSAECGMRNVECGQASGTTYTNKSGPSWLLLSCIAPVFAGNRPPGAHVLANQRVTQKKTRGAVTPPARNRQQIKDLNRNLICGDKGVRSAECGMRNAECGVPSAECGVASAECGVGSAEWGMRSGECGMRSGECGVRNAEWRVRNAECGMRRFKPAVSNDRGLPPCSMPSRPREMEPCRCNTGVIPGQPD